MDGGLTDEDFLARVTACKGLNTQTIAEAFAGTDLDEITYGLLGICAERADTSIFSTFPLTIRQTMYGDDGVSEWIVRYAEDGTRIDPVSEDVELDAHVRWERWEDCVRLINGDVNGASLMYAIRVRGLGEGRFASTGRWWFMGTNFTGDNDPYRPGRLMGYLRTKVGDEERLRQYVEEVGLDRLLAARADSMAHTFTDLRASELLAGTWVRWEIEGHDTAAQVDWSDANTWTLQMVPHSERDTDLAHGVAIVYTTPNAFLYAAGGREELSGQLVAGTVKLVGSDERTSAFSAATRRLYTPGAMS